MKIIQSPVRNFGHRPAEADIDCIVVHHTGGGTITGALAWWNDPKSQASAHYLIDRAGVIRQCVPENARAWHAGASVLFGVDDVNDFSIGVELHGTGIDFPFQQVEALIFLCADIMSRHRHVTVDRIVGHDFVATPPGRKTDPGPNFPWASFRAHVRWKIQS